MNYLISTSDDVIIFSESITHAHMARKFDEKFTRAGWIGLQGFEVFGGCDSLGIEPYAPVEDQELIQKVFRKL